jgi:hypothetical protein
MRRSRYALLGIDDYSVFFNTTIGRYSGYHLLNRSLAGASPVTSFCLSQFSAACSLFKPTAGVDCEWHRPAEHFVWHRNGQGILRKGTVPVLRSANEPKFAVMSMCLKTAI